MKRRKHQPSSLSLFEPTLRWSELSLDVRQKLIDQLAQMLVPASRSTSAQATPSAAARHPSFPTPENNHDPQ
jgi:hypothetical protein